MDEALFTSTTYKTVELNKSQPKHKNEVLFSECKTYNKSWVIKTCFVGKI